MRILLDTHLLLWALATPERIPVSARRLIEQAEVYVSAASIWEIGIKAALGKLQADPALIAEQVEPAGFVHLPVTCWHAAEVSRLPPLHRDPFDRLLVAQAMTEPLVLLTNDGHLPPYGKFVTLA